ncbi:MAG: anhydro-N-acetylmuramic acid kinase [Alphaproteobacteria bacterium]
MTDYHILGLMTGTSADGIDLGFITSDGKKIKKFGKQDFFPYDQATQNQIASWFGRDDIDPHLSKPATIITDLHISAILQFLKKHNIDKSSLSAIGFHGQTIYHAPEKKITCQLGNGENLAKALHIPVVWQFRQKDIMMGGQGAPLMPLMHRAVVDYFQLPLPLMIINIGGVANITLMDKHHIYAGDIAIGNAMIDDYARQYLNIPKDEGGKKAMLGKPDKTLLAKWLNDDFFAKPIPKSLDRNYLKSTINHDLKDKNHHNNLATLSLFTSQAIATSINRISRDCAITPTILLVAGGGRHNEYVMQHLASQLQPMILKNLDDAIDKKIADNLEAFGFGFLASRVMANLPLTLPTTTGVIAPTMGGRLTMPPHLIT